MIDTVNIANKQIELKSFTDESGFVSIHKIEEWHEVKITAFNNCLDIIWNKSVVKNSGLILTSQLFIDSFNNVYFLSLGTDVPIYGVDSYYVEITKFDFFGNQKFTKRIASPDGFYFQSSRSIISCALNDKIIFASTLSGKKENNNAILVIEFDSSGNAVNQAIFNTAYDHIFLKSIEITDNESINILGITTNQVEKEQLKLLTLNSKLGLIKRIDMGFDNLSLIVGNDFSMYTDQESKLFIFNNGTSDYAEGTITNLVYFDGDYKQKWHVQIRDSNSLNTRFFRFFEQDSMFYLPVVCLNKTKDTASLKIAVLNQNGSLISYSKVNSQLPGYQYLHQLKNFCSGKNGQVVFSWFDQNSYGFTKFGIEGTKCTRLVEDKRGYTLELKSQAFHLKNVLAKYETIKGVKSRVTKSDVNLVSKPRPYFLLCDFAPNVNEKVIDDTLVCTSNSFRFNAISKINYSFQWFSGNTTNVQKIDSTGTYWLRREYNGCVFTDTAHVLFSSDLQRGINENYEYCFGDTFILNLPKLDSLAFTVRSSLKGFVDENNYLRTLDTGQFVLKYNYFGCVDSVSIILNHEKLVIDSTVLPKSICPDLSFDIGSYSSNYYNWKSDGQDIDSSKSFFLENLKVKSDTSFKLSIESVFGCHFQFDIMVNMLDSIQGLEIKGPNSVCSGDEFTLSPYFNFKNDSSLIDFYWNDSNKGFTYNKNLEKDQLIVLEAVDVCDRSFYDSLFIQVLPKPDFKFEILSDTLFADTEYLIDFKVDDSTKYSFEYIIDSININSQIDKITFLNSGRNNLIVKLENQYGCKISGLLKFDVISQNFIYIPNSFTPDGDLINDEFVFIGNFVETETLIFNRSGQRVASLKNESWNGTFDNGKLVPSNAYYYIIKATFKNGQEIIRNGTVNVFN
ncbi:MAG: gliding motility-associated C-terminal domain-containing protein [Bacteroidia bacterium]